MSTKERILTIRLLEKIQGNPLYAAVEVLQVRSSAQTREEQERSDA